MLSRLLRHPVTLIIGVILGLFLLYETCVRFFAYTGDAYVMSDIVVVSSEIEGPVSKLAVQNNEAVAAGQLLFEIERTPYALKVQETQAALATARADLELARDEVNAAKASVTAAQAVQTNAQDQARPREGAGDGGLFARGDARCRHPRRRHRRSQRNVLRGTGSR
ncbi:biotin/lipoyl-binding protein [Ancylobacter dichloromethanicus]